MGAPAGYAGTLSCSSGGRVWELRANVTTYDGWCVALAEILPAPLITLDRRLTRAAGPRCTCTLPPVP